MRLIIPLNIIKKVATNDRITSSLSEASRETITPKQARNMTIAPAVNEMNLIVSIQFNRLDVFSILKRKRVSEYI